MNVRVGEVIKLDGLVVVIRVDNHLPRSGEILHTVNNDQIQLYVDEVNGSTEVIALNLLDNKSLVVGDEIQSSSEELSLPVGDQIFGRVFNALGQTLDGENLVDPPTTSLNVSRVANFSSPQPNDILETGIKVIDFFTPFVKGRRTGIIGGAGVGKTVLTTELIRNVAHSNSALGFFVGIGERIREGHELHITLKEQGMSDNTVMYLGQMNENAALRSLVGSSAAAVARHYADQGKDILFFVDNVYRFTQARNELSSMKGQIQSEGGYQPSLFSELHQFEDSLYSNGGGSITSVQSIYVPADDLTDPAVVEIHQQLDSVIVLSRDIFESGIFPAVDLLATTSSLLVPSIVGQRHCDLVEQVRAVLTQYENLKTITAIVGEGELSPVDLQTYRRAQKFIQYFTQHMFVTEELSGHSGEYIERAHMLDEIESILLS